MKVITFLIIILILTKTQNLIADTVRLKDGQVFFGEIIEETPTYLIIKTKYENRVISNSQIDKVFPGTTGLEQVYILMDDDTVKFGYMIYQDDREVIFKPDEKSPDEIIPKTKIKQISNEEIMLYNPKIFFSAGIIMPLNSSKSKLTLSPIYIGGGGIDIPQIQNLGFSIYAGFSNMKSEKFNSMKFQIIPIMTAFKYNFHFWNILITPYCGNGLSILLFDDNESKSLRGYKYTSDLGCMVGYELFQKKVMITLFSSNLTIWDTGFTYLSSMVYYAGLSIKI